MLSCRGNGGSLSQNIWTKFYFLRYIMVYLDLLLPLILKSFDISLLFKQMGKFYELFEMDAHVGAKELDLQYMKVWSYPSSFNSKSENWFYLFICGLPVFYFILSSRPGER